ncbi:histidine kinase dimerization/phosphoacceptor domain -containing protein [Ekhidna sp.]|uniref:histidine kinase dimerization/phosphoacceptor domain -containing protein n=1 Tax=Ekhidna sp. TaxID=2608089 RepID=UPI003CCBD427
MRVFDYTPKQYKNSEHASIASVLNIGFILLPLLLLVVFIRQLLQSDYDMTIVIGTGIVFSFITRYLFLKGHLRRAVMMIAVFFTILLTVVCSFGNGIHDIGLIGFPILIGFSSIVLKQRQLIASSSLSILGLAWLVLGDKFNFFEPIPVPTGNTGDFIIASLLIIMGGFVAFSLTNNMKDSLKHANHEVEVSKREANKLIKEIDEKEEIIEEIHRAVINSLNHIRHLIDNRIDDKQTETLKSVFRSLERKILVIEAAHETLLKEQEPIQLELGDFTRTLVPKFEKDLNAPVLHINAEQSACIVSLDQAIYYGICVLELMLEADKHSPTLLKVGLAHSDSLITLIVSGFENATYEKSGLIMDLLPQQLKGKLEKLPNEMKLTFKSTGIV